MNSIPIPGYAVDCNTRRSPGITYGDARHVKSRIASTLRYFNRWSRIGIYKRQGEQYVKFLDSQIIESIFNDLDGDVEETKKEVYRIIDDA